jgi:cytidylate kinase
MLAAAQNPPLIVVGHGAQALFRGRASTLHVRLTAPLASRVERICGREGCDRAAAAALARRMDDARRAYVRRYYHTDIRDPALYDLQCNTAQVQIEELADCLASIIGSRRSVVA